MIVEVDGVETFVHAPPGSPSRRRSMLFVHGAGMDHSVWRFQAHRAASAGWVALAVDLPGHGRSGGTPFPSIEEMGAWCERLITGLGLQRPIVVGHSMGSLIALELARRSATAGIGLVGTADRMAVHPELLDAAREGRHLAIELVVGWSVAGDQRLGGHPSPGTSTRGVLTRLVESGLSRNLGVDLVACDRYDPVAATATVTAPALIVSGERDLMTPASAARRLASDLNDCAIIEIAGGSHMVMFEHPDAVSRPLLAWAESIVDAA